MQYTTSQGADQPRQVSDVLSTLVGERGTAGGPLSAAVHRARLAASGEPHPVDGADKVYRALLGFSGGGARSVAASPHDLAHRLALDPEAANEALLTLRASGLVAFEDDSQHPRSLARTLVITVHVKHVSHVSVNANDHVNHDTSTNVATNDTSLSGSGLEDTSRVGRGSAAPLSRGSLPSENSSEVDLARARQLAQGMGEPDKVALYLDVVRRFRPKIVDFAEHVALGTPDSEIRKSRGALFFATLRRCGHELAEREREAFKRRRVSVNEPVPPPPPLP